MFNSFFIIKSFLGDYEKIKELVKKDEIEKVNEIAEKWGLNIEIVEHIDSKNKKIAEIYLPSIIKSFLEDYEEIKKLVKKGEIEKINKIAEKWGLTIKIVGYIDGKNKKKAKIYLYPIEWNFSSTPYTEGFLIK